MYKKFGASCWRFNSNLKEALHRHLQKWPSVLQLFFHLRVIVVCITDLSRRSGFRLFGLVNLNSTSYFHYQFIMSFVTTLYNNVLRRSSTYALAIVSGAFFFERAFDLATEHLYSEINKGVS